MIVSRTPFRVSLFGGGTDYPAWYLQHGGAVIGTAIDKYCYISIRKLPPFFAHRHRIVYSIVENVREFSEIQHPAVRAVLTEMRVEDGVEIHHDGDLPARSGLGSSSSFTVGLINAVHALNGKMSTSRDLALEAIRIEQDVIKENVGSQDQIWAAYGGFNRVDFGRDGGFSVSPVIMPPERRDELRRSLILAFTGVSRIADSLARKQIENFDQRQVQLRSMGQMVDEAQAILASPSRPLADLGRLLHESWRLKRELAEGVTTDQIDTLYQAARDAGALGGKVLGAGGGGFVLFFVDPARRKAVLETLKGLVTVNIKLGAEGSRIVVYEPQGL
ncbi:MAG: kinase [Alphaproteobacteria bacterium]|nr:kinase [Alphaproteobacteria bacterium]